MAKEVTYASAQEARAAAAKSRTIDRADGGPTKSQISQRLTAITPDDISDVMSRARATWERVRGAQRVESEMVGPDMRDLIHRFWQLSSSQRREIAQSFDLLEDGEIRLLEPERYRRALARAGDREIMGEVAAAVARMEN